MFNYERSNVISDGESLESLQGDIKDKNNELDKLIRNQEIEFTNKKLNEINKELNEINNTQNNYQNITTD